MQGSRTRRRTVKTSKVSKQVEPSEVHPDAHPVIRVSTEYHLRGIDLLTQMQADLIDGQIVMTLVHDQMTAAGLRKSIGVRELSRKLDMPHETIRRRVQELAEKGHCVVSREGVAIPAVVQRGRRVATFLRKIYVNAIRLLADLTRIKVAAFAATSRRPVVGGRLTKEQAVIAAAATGLLLAGLRALRTFWDGDLTRGLVYTAIWTANVKHVTNTAPAADRGALPDSQRIPVSVLAISRSLRLPYETVRRHADSMVQDGICIRMGRRGLLVPMAFIRRITAGPGHRLPPRAGFPGRAASTRRQGLAEGRVEPLDRCSKASSRTRNSGRL